MSHNVVNEKKLGWQQEGMQEIALHVAVLRSYAYLVASDTATGFKTPEYRSGQPLIAVFLCPLIAYFTCILQNLRGVTGGASSLTGFIFCAGRLNPVTPRYPD